MCVLQMYMCIWLDTGAFKCVSCCCSVSNIHAMISEGGCKDGGLRYMGLPCGRGRKRKDWGRTQEATEKMKDKLKPGWRRKSQTVTKIRRRAKKQRGWEEELGGEQFVSRKGRRPCWEMIDGSEPPSAVSASQSCQGQFEVKTASLWAKNSHRMDGSFSYFSLRTGHYCNNIPRCNINIT